MSQRVLITEPIKDGVIQRLRSQFDVTVGERGTYNDEAVLINDIAGYHALLPMLSNPVTSSVIEAGSDLKVIANHAVGYNNIDLDAARRAGIKVANTPGVLTDATADCAIALMLAAARHICSSQQYLYEDKFNGWEPLGFLGLELKGKTIGILGMGRIGTAVARRASAFGLDILYHNRNRIDPEKERQIGATYLDGPVELARRSDVLSLNCPLTDETHHLIDSEIFELMPDHAILVNTARGPIVDEAALAQALEEGEIGGAGIDVFEHEPEVHPNLLQAPNCVLTPHIGSATHETREAIGTLAANAITGILTGKPDNEIANLIQL